MESKGNRPTRPTQARVAANASSAWYRLISARMRDSSEVSVCKVLSQIEYSVTNKEFLFRFELSNTEPYKYNSWRDNNNLFFKVWTT